MNQIYACRKGRENPFTGTTSISTVPTAKRSGSRTDFSKLLTGVSTFKPRLSFVIPMLIAFVLGFAPNKASAQICLNQNFDGVVAPALPAGWASTTAGVGGAPWVTSNTTSVSAPNNATSGLTPATASSATLTSESLVITSAAAVITFQNNYNTELSFDGMVLEISLNNGATWADIITAGGSFLVGAYNGAVPATNFLGARPAWTGNSGGYITTSVNLPAGANGQTVKFRWIVGTDASNGGGRVRIDNVTVNCGACLGRVHNINTGLDYCTIQSAIDAPQTLNGHTLNIDNGAPYIEDVRVYKDLTLNGQSMAGVVVQPATTNETGGSAGTVVFRIQSAGVTIQNLTVDGNGPGVGPVDAAIGILTDWTFAPGDWTNADVHGVTVQNVYTAGLEFANNVANTNVFTAHDNFITNVVAAGVGTGGSWGILNYGMAGPITSNTITNANIGIATNYSFGSVISLNTVNGNAGGTDIESDNNGGAGGPSVADQITNNITIAGANGVVVFQPAQAVSVTNNSITNYTDNGVTVIGSDPTFLLTTQTVSSNDINGNTNTTTTGIYITNVSTGGVNATEDVTVIANNNNVWNNTSEGFLLETAATRTINLQAHNNSILNPTWNARSTGAGTLAGADNMVCNWWGSTDLATVTSKIQNGAATGVIVFVPYLTSGVDASANRGFQPTVPCAGPPCSNITTTISSPAQVCQNQPANLTMTAAGGVAPYTFNYTLNGVPQTPAVSDGAGTAVVPINTSTVGNQVFQITTVTGLNGCTNGPNPPPTSSTTTVRPLPSGTIINSGGQTVCAGTSGQANVFLGGTPRFDGSFVITVINGTGVGSTLNWTSMQVGGPQGVTIPAANLTNTSSSATTYRISWGTLTDNNPGGPSCIGPAGNLTGFEDIVVLPIPDIAVLPSQATLTAAGDVCPGATMAFTVSNPNAVAGAMYNWVAKDAGGNTLAFANSVPFGTNVSTNLGLTAANCNTVNNPVTFTFTPVGPGPNACQGPNAQRSVNIRDVTAPTLIAGAPASSQNTGNTCITAIPAPPSAATIQAFYTDNCTALHTAQVIAAATGTNCAWSRVTTYSIADACNNTTTFVFTQTGGDTQAPTWTSAPGSLNTTIEYCTGNLAAAQAMTPVASDNCNATPTVIKTPGIFAVGSCPTRGTITNTFIAGDGCNNTSVVFTQTITITDNTGPIITPNPVPPQTLNIGGAGCNAALPNYVTSLPITANDCAAPQAGLPAAPAIAYNAAGGNGTITQSPVPGTLIFGAGGQIVPITITATDACGNSTVTVFNVTLVDATPPTAVCRNLTNATQAQINSEILLGAGGTATITPSQINNGSADNCSPVTLSFQAAIPTNQLRQFTCADIPNGQQSADINVVLVVTDASGNQNTCTAIVRVRDNTPASVTCPANQTLTKNANCTTTLPNYVPQVTATDNCGVQSIVQSPAAGSIFGAAIVSQVITMTVTDVHTNVSTCTFTVNFIDNTPPIITCPANITANTGAGNTDCAVVVTYAQPTATDNCQGPGFPGAVTTTLVSGPASGSQFFVGVTTVTYRATDAAGNSSTCSFTVTVSDNTVPIAVCGPNRTVSASNPGCVFTFNGGTSWDPAIFDNCLLANPPITFFGSGATTFGPVNTLNGRTFNLGVTTVTATVRDAAQPVNNVSAPCNFTVTVVDNLAPSFTVCPGNFTVTTAAPNGLPGCRATVTLPQPTTVQNCTTVQSWLVTGATPNSSGIGAFPTSFPMNVGVTQVQFRLDDAAGNSPTCTYFVTVNNVSAGAITGTATASQNAIITSTITFTGSGGTPNYCFTYDISTNGGPFGATQTVCTTGGQSTVTVSQSNAVVGTFQYRLVSAVDANGCAMAITPPNTATITVVAGAPDLTSSQFFTTTQIAAGGVIDEVIVIRNVGTAPTSGPISFTITNYGALTGLTVTQTTAGTNVTIGIDTYTISAGWTFTAGTGTFTSNNVIPAGGSNNIGIRITRGSCVSPPAPPCAPGTTAGANGSVTQTTTIAAGTGGGETPSTNNTISNTLLKN